MHPPIPPPKSATAPKYLTLFEGDKSILLKYKYICGVVSLHLDGIIRLLNLVELRLILLAIHHWEKFCRS